MSAGALHFFVFCAHDKKIMAFQRRARLFLVCVAATLFVLQEVPRTCSLVLGAHDEPATKRRPTIDDKVARFFHRFDSVADYTEDRKFGAKVETTVQPVLDFVSANERDFQLVGNDCFKLARMLREQVKALADFYDATRSHCNLNVQLDDQPQPMVSMMVCHALIGSVLANTTRDLLLRGGHFGPYHVSALTCAAHHMFTTGASTPAPKAGSLMAGVHAFADAVEAGTNLSMCVDGVPRTEFDKVDCHDAVAVRCHSSVADKAACCTCVCFEAWLTVC